MKLISLQLQFFRQYRAADIRFFDGITGVVGRNGTGKTTILEAIAWALYGQKALQRMDRGKAETIRSRGAKPDEHTEVTLDFEFAGQLYRIVRRSSDAAILADGKPLHTGIENVTKSVMQLLRMDSQAFFTSFFTGQKDLAFLRDVGAGGREAYVGRLLGHERLTKARDLANTERLALERDIRALSEGLGDVEEIKQRKSEAAVSVKLIAQEADVAEQAYRQARQLLAEIEPRKNASEENQKRHSALENDLALLNTQLHSLQGSRSRDSSDLQQIINAEAEILSLAPMVEEYENLKRRHEVLVELEKAEARREGLLSQIGMTSQEIVRVSSRVEEMEARFSGLEKIQRDIAGREETLRSAQSGQERIERSLLTRYSRLEAEISAHSVHVRETSEHLEQLMKAGPEGACPTCERALGYEYEKVTGQMRESIRAENKEIEQKKAGLIALKQKSPELETVKAEITECEKLIAELKEKAFAAKSAGENLKAEQVRATELDQQLIKLKADLANLPSGYDAEELAALKKRGAELKPKRARALELAGAVQRKPDVLKRIEEQEKLLSELSRGIAAKNNDLTALCFSPDNHQTMLNQWAQASQAAQSMKDAASTTANRLEVARAILNAVEKEEASYRERAKALEDKQHRRRHLEFLTAKFDDLRKELNSQIRPKLAEEASRLISEITDGRYSEVDLDENYSPRLYDDGEYKPVISGGEEDILHLCLRLAISRMIAERAGVDLGLLILDEVFGSLDEIRRENVISLLTNLKGLFQQILLITHIESIHDMVDRCIWVDYDASSRTSRVREANTPVESMLLPELESV